MQKIVQVHMLPTDKVDRKQHVLWTNKNGYLLHTHSSATNITPQHLYFTSDKEIKEGEWAITTRGELFKATKENNNSIYGDKKIVATTNPELWRDGLQDVGKAGYSVDDFVPTIPKIPLSFVKEYVEKQGNIKEVSLEYYRYQEHNMPYRDSLKLDSQGCVIISPIEEKIYTRLELFNAVHSVFYEFNTEQFNEIKMKNDYGIYMGQAISNWFNKKYPK